MTAQDLWCVFCGDPSCYETCERALEVAASSWSVNEPDPATVRAWSIPRCCDLDSQCRERPECVIGAMLMG